MNHPVSAGFVTLYEGVTICYPNGPTPEFKVFAYNTNEQLQPSILYRNPTLEKGGIWIDTAFTKLWPSQHKNGEPEVRQYTINAIAYISKRTIKKV